MGYPTVMTDVQVIGIGANLDIRPPLNQSWVITMVGSSLWAGVPPNAVPQVDVSLFDTVNVAAIMTGANVRGWYRPLRLIIDRTNYLRLGNVGGAQANISFSAELLRFSSGQTNCMSDLQAAIGVGATYSVQPLATMDWKITDFGSDQWVGAAPAAVPNLTIEINDGTLAAMILSPTEVRQWEDQLELFVNNAVYVDITNSAAVVAVICFTAELYRQVGAAQATVVRASVQAAGVGANVDFQPPAGEEHRITMIGSSRWIGVSPWMFPDLTAHIFDATNASQIQNSTDFSMNGHKFQLALSRTNYLRCTNLGAGMNIAVNGELLQRYA